MLLVDLCQTSKISISTNWLAQCQHFIESVNLEFVFHLWATQDPQTWFTSKVSPLALKSEQHRQFSSVIHVIVRDKHISGKFVIGWRLKTRCSKSIFSFSCLFWNSLWSSFTLQQSLSISFCIGDLLLIYFGVGNLLLYGALDSFTDYPHDSHS